MNLQNLFKNQNGVYVMAIAAKMEPVGRFGSPEEIANAVIWMCTDEASFITGHPMVVDGGFVAQ